MFFVIMLVSLK